MNVRRADVPADRLRVIIRVLVDVGITLMLIASGFWPPEFGGPPEPSPLSFALVAAAIVAMLLRRRTPKGAACAAVALTVAALLVGGSVAASFLALLVSVSTVAKLTDRRTTQVTAVAAAVVVWCASFVILGPETTDLPVALLIIVSIGFVAAAGDASRSRRAYLEELTDRAQRAEETKEAEALRAVADERVAIARDLHDLIAHQIAVVSLNAGVASRALRDRPEDAERALKTIHGAAQTVLEEISGLLTVLRGNNHDAGALRLAPTPGLAQLPDLIRQFESGGLAVRQRIEGTPREIPEAVDAVAYRALQEALTNALKHGRGDGAHPASALVQLDYQAGSIVLTVTNPVSDVRRATSNPDLGGHGLNGVRERVASVRGQVKTGRGPGPVYRFTASLPTSNPTPGTAEVVTNQTVTNRSLP